MSSLTLDRSSLDLELDQASLFDDALAAIRAGEIASVVKARGPHITNVTLENGTKIEFFGRADSARFLTDSSNFHLDPRSTRMIVNALNRALTDFFKD